MPSTSVGRILSTKQVGWYLVMVLQEGCHGSNGSNERPSASPRIRLYAVRKALYIYNPMTWGWDLDHQSYSRERSGFLGHMDIWILKPSFSNLKPVAATWVMKYYQPKQGTRKEEIPQNFNTVAFFDSPEMGHLMILGLWKSDVWSWTKNHGQLAA